MADPINHDTTSTVATVGGEAVKGSLIGAAIPILGGAALGALLGSFLGPVGMGVGALIGGAVGTTGAALPALIGGALGGLNGRDKVQAEQQAFRDRMQGGPQSQAEINGVQQGYQIGRADGQQIGFQQGAQYGAQAVIAQVQQHVAAQQQALAQQQMAAQPPAETPDVAATSEAKTGFADKMASCHCESHVGKVEGDRAQAATAVAGAQIG